MNSKKIARRNAAAARFRFIPRASLSPMPNETEYAEYLERKLTEAKSLGLVPNNASASFAVNLLA